MTSILMIFDLRLFLSSGILLITEYIVKANKNIEHSIEFTCDKCTFLPLVTNVRKYNIYQIMLWVAEIAARIPSILL
jgi:hypothetical protein